MVFVLVFVFIFALVFVLVFIFAFTFAFIFVFAYIFVFVNLWWLEALLRKHGIPLAVLKVEAGRRPLHWHQGRHLRGLQLL